MRTLTCDEWKIWFSYHQRQSFRLVVLLLPVVQLELFPYCCFRRLSSRFLNRLRNEIQNKIFNFMTLCRCNQIIHLQIRLLRFRNVCAYGRSAIDEQQISVEATDPFPIPESVNKIRHLPARRNHFRCNKKNLPYKFDGMQSFARRFAPIQSNLLVVVLLNRSMHHADLFHMDQVNQAH